MSSRVLTRLYTWIAVDAEGTGYTEEEFGSISAIPAEIRHLIVLRREDPDNPAYHHRVTIPEGAAPICLWTTPIRLNLSTGAQTVLEPVVGIGWEFRDDGNTAPLKSVEWQRRCCRCVTWIAWDGSAITTDTELDLGFLANG